jgi:UDP-glucuronate decarboxylase
MGHRVICVDNFCTGTIENVLDLRAEEHFTFVEHDVCRPFEFAVDQIYNLACPAAPVHYQRTPIMTTRTSVLGAINALELATRLGIPVLQASTSEIYGDPQIHPQREDYWGNVNPTGTRACYDEGKRCAETLFFDFERERKTKIRVARIFNTYGPRMRADDGRVISNFVVQALRGEPITLHGSGEQTRSFCYVDDLVCGLIKFMNHGGVRVGPINLGNPSEISISKLASTVIRHTGSPSTITFEPLPEDDPMQRCPDISRARQLLNWRPTTMLEEGLAKTIAYFRETHGSA